MLTSSSRQPLRRLILVPALTAALLGGSAFASEHGGGSGKGGGQGGSGGGDGCKQCFAIVGSGGTLIRGNGAVSVMHAQTGIYDITFRKPVAACAATASATAGPSDPVVPAYAMVIPSAASLNALRVVTFAGGTNAPAEQAFQVVVDCG
jgi:hypothetical protein